jgi:hypothetical protein
MSGWIMVSGNLPVCRIKKLHHRLKIVIPQAISKIYF